MINARPKVGIFYICTGKYRVFFPEFFQTFTTYFLLDCDLTFLVFTDTLDYIEPIDARVRLFHQEDQPWPWPTLLRFHMMQRVATQCTDFDYLFFMNANLMCNQVVGSADFLPRHDRGEHLVAVQHPGYLGKPRAELPFETNPLSTAYVPPEGRDNYCLGGINGGTASAFLALADALAAAVDSDLTLGLVARWHDESHFNRYIKSRDDVRFLSPAYCFPEGWDGPYDPMIKLRDKSRFFDVNFHKGWQPAGRSRPLPARLGRALKPLLRLRPPERLGNSNSRVRDTPTMQADPPWEPRF